MGPVRTRLSPRPLFLVPAAACLLLGVHAGLALLGLPVPIPSVFERAPEFHGPLLVLGFVGGLIALERAVALRAGWAYTAPVLLSAGPLLALVPVLGFLGRAVLAAGAVIHVGQYVAISRRQQTTATAIQLLGAGCALAAALASLGGAAASRLVPLLAAFLVLTIAGERLELARLAAPGPRAERLLFALAIGLAVSAVVSLTAPTAAVVVAGLVLAGIVIWLLRFDVARRFAGRRGLPGYVAVCLLAGYAWLTAAAAGWVLGGARTDGAVYDATTHAVFLGFVITMIMAHAPVILPAVLGVRLPYHPALYVPVALLQLALLVRVVGGDAWGSVDLLRAGGVGAAVAMALFAGVAATLSVRIGRRPAGGRAENVAS